MASKKLAAIFALFITLSIILSSVFVIAQDSLTVGRAGTGLADQMTKFIDFIQKAGEPIFKPLLGPNDGGDMLTTKILMFFLITLVIISILGAADNPFGSGWINVVVGAIVSILGIRFLPQDFITMITTPSQAFVAAAVTLIPFILFFFIMEKSLARSRTLRKISWITFGVLMLALWVYNWNNEKLFNTELGWLAWWSYPLVTILAFAMMIYDRTIQAWFAKEKAESAITEAKASARKEQVLKQIEKIRKMGEAGTPEEAKMYKEQIASLRKVLKELE